MPKKASRPETDYREIGKEELLRYHQSLGEECDRDIIALLKQLDLPTKMGMRASLIGLANYSQKINYRELPLDEIMEKYEKTGEEFTTSQLLERLTQLQPDLLDQQRKGIITPRSLSTHISHLKKKGPPYNRIVETKRATDGNRIFKIQPQE